MKKEKNIKSVNKALDIILLFTHRYHGLGIAEISHILNIPKGTVHGLVRTLLKAGFLQQDPAARKYQIGLKIYELGIILAGDLEINQKALSPINNLVKSTRLASRIAIWDGDSALITLSIDPYYNSPFVYQIGPRIPAYSSGLGKAILAFLEDQELNDYLHQTKLVPYTTNTIIQKKLILRDLGKTRQRGYSLDREETILGISCIGAPIFGREGCLVASISLSGHPNRFRKEELAGLEEKLIKTAGEISRSMGYFPESLKLTPMLSRI